MRRVMLSVTMILSMVVAWAAPAAASAGGRGGPGAIVIDGAVSQPHTYSPTALGALPSETVPVTVPTPFGPKTVVATGVSLESLVSLAAPTLPPVKNASLRATVTVTGAFDRTVTFALGELEATFGNHDAVVAIGIGGNALREDPTLLVAGDSSLARSVPAVQEITIAVTSPEAVVPPTSGGLDVEHGHHTTVLSADLLARLPGQIRTVSFLTGSGPQTHVERGPYLADVLRAAGVESEPTTFVAGVGSDDYVAAETPAEATFGGRPLLISLHEDGTPLTQPRLVTDGDVEGGRYVSDLVDLVIGEGHGLNR